MSTYIKTLCTLFVKTIRLGYKSPQPLFVLLKPIPKKEVKTLGDTWGSLTPPPPRVHCAINKNIPEVKGNNQYTNSGVISLYGTPKQG